jgi:hypothetical protein
MARRIGAFRAMEQGMSPEEARVYSDRLYPPTLDDIAIEHKLRANATGETSRDAIPWPSTIALLYPIVAMFYIASYSPAPPFTVIIGYGLANLGYLLLLTGVFAGHFRILHLERRLYVVLAGAVFFALGTVLTNIPQA